MIQMTHLLRAELTGVAYQPILLRVPASPGICHYATSRGVCWRGLKEVFPNAEHWFLGRKVRKVAFFLPEYVGDELPRCWTDLGEVTLGVSRSKRVMIAASTGAWRGAVMSRNSIPLHGFLTLNPSVLSEEGLIELALAAEGWLNPTLASVPVRVAIK